MVDVQQRGRALNKRHQRQAFSERQERGAVGERVTLPLLGHEQCRAHALPRFFAVMDGSGIDSRQLPELQLLLLRAGPIAPRDEGRRAGDARHGPGGILEATDAGGVGGGARDEEIVVHDQPALDEVT
jgi:hypothetical protein